MEKLPLPPIEPARADKDQPKLRIINRSLKILAHALGILENGIRPFSQLDPFDASTGFSMARGDFSQLKNASIETREALETLFHATDSMPLLENPLPMHVPANRNPTPPLIVAKRLLSGFAGCRNSIQSLLEHEPRVLKLGFAENPVGQRVLTRLATLSTVIQHFQFGSPEEAMSSVRTLKSETLDSSGNPKYHRSRITKPIDSSKAKMLRIQFEEKKHYFGSELAYGLAQEICMQMEDCERGIPFEDLRDLFGLSSLNLKRELDFLRLIVKSFNVILVGSFEPKGRPTIAFETEIRNSLKPST